LNCEDAKKDAKNAKILFVLGFLLFFALFAFLAVQSPPHGHSDGTAQTPGFCRRLS